MGNSVEKSNASLREAFKDTNLDVSHIDLSNIEYLISDNFITRGSVYKNESFNKGKSNNFTDKLLNNTDKG